MGNQSFLSAPSQEQRRTHYTSKQLRAPYLVRPNRPSNKSLHGDVTYRDSGSNVPGD